MAKAQPAKKQVTAARADDWANVATGLGLAARDKRLSAGVTTSYVWSRNELLELYRGDAVASLIVDDRAKEMLRKWFTLKLDEDPEGDKARDVMDAIDGVDGLPLRERLFELIRDARLLGGAGLFLGVNDGLSPDQPINYDAIQSFDFVTVIDRYSMEPHSYYTDRLLPKYGEVAQYRITDSDTFGAYAPPDRKKGTKPMQLVHSDRVIRMDGIKLAPRDMLANNGWGDPVLTRVREILRDDASLWSSMALLMQDYSSAIVKMKGLAEALTMPEGQAIVRARMTGVELARSVARITLLDGGSGNPGDTGEEWGRDTISVSGLADMIDRFMQRVSMAARMPMTRLWGTSPGGLNATGEGDLQWYHEDIERDQEVILRPALNKILRVLMRAKEGPTKGVEPDRWSINFCPLKQLNGKEQAELEKIVAEKDAIYIDKGVLDPREIAQSRYGGPEFSTETQLDDEVRELMNEKHQVEAEAALKTAERTREGEPSPDMAAKLAAQPAKKAPF